MIGYKFLDEPIKDEFISKLPHIEIFEFDFVFFCYGGLRKKNKCGKEQIRRR
jgi:hypothetical protein